MPPHRPDSAQLSGVRRGLAAVPRPATQWFVSGAEFAAASLGDAQLVWKKDVGAGFSAPVIAGGKLILFHRVNGEGSVECMEAATGKRLWIFEYATAYRDDFGFDEGPRGTPAIAGGRVYTFGAAFSTRSIWLPAERYGEWTRIRNSAFARASSELLLRPWSRATRSSSMPADRTAPVSSPSTPPAATCCGRQPATMRDTPRPQRPPLMAFAVFCALPAMGWWPPIPPQERFAFNSRGARGRTHR
jgi:hypothetical protein